MPERDSDRRETTTAASTDSSDDGGTGEATFEEGTAERASTPANDHVQILLIEDNPGDARLIEEMLRETDELTLRMDVETAGEKTTSVTHERRLEDGLEYVTTNDVDIVLLDLELPDSRGLKTLDSVTEATEGRNALPIVVLTGLQDQQAGIEAINRGAQDFLVKDEVTSPLLIRTIHHAIERARQEHERIRRREQLEALNRLNRIGQEITHVVITAETRSELEQRVCDRLSGPDAYAFAWIGDVEPGRDTIVPRASAGEGGSYLDEIEITIDDSETAKGPTGTAARTGRIQIAQNLQTDPTYRPWRDSATEHGFRSSAAIPLVHEDLRYGILNVYSTSPRAFAGPETGVLARLGDVIGHAISSIERRDALVTDSVTELEFRLESFASALVTLTSEHARHIQFDRIVRNNDRQLVYGSVSGIPREAFLDGIDRSDGIEDGRILAGGSEEYEFELVAPSTFSLFDAVATHGGRVRSATIDDGEFRFVIELPQRREARPLIELVDEYRSDATLLAQRSHERENDTQPQTVVETELTAKQQTALETAYFAGYFDWPRGSTGEEIAEKLDISPATFNQHLRTAERKIFDAIFEE